jgi:protocatechuate 3,4-dioxygenase beta subunit
LPHYRPDPAGTHPPLLSPDYASTQLRAPLKAPVDLPQRLTEVTGPVLGDGLVRPGDADLTRGYAEEPAGQRRTDDPAQSGGDLAGQRGGALSP